MQRTYRFSTTLARLTAIIGVLGFMALDFGCDVPAPTVPPSDSASVIGASALGNVELHDPLSMPAEPTLSPENFKLAAECGACHPNHYREWKTSMHAYAVEDPIWRTLVGIRQADFDGQRDQFCTQCHSAIGTRGGEMIANFSFDDITPIVQEGITCESCHKVVGLERVYNSGHIIDEHAAIRGPIPDPFPNTFHESVYSPLHDTSEFCGACHDVFEQHGLKLERPFEEWSESPAKEAGQNCQSCHMPTYTGKAAINEGVPERDNLHLHRFIGVAIPLKEGFISDPEEAKIALDLAHALLRTAGSIELEAATAVASGEQLDLFVTVRNLISAHDLPTGATFNRQVWVEVTATDIDGNVLYQTGDLDENGDLRNYFSTVDQFGDPDLIVFNSSFIDPQGNPTVFPWKAVEHISNSLSPLFARTFTLFVPVPADTSGSITIDARLRFRAFPPFLLRALGHDDFADRLEIVDIDETTLMIDVR